jgi:hypothetical protein
MFLEFEYFQTIRRKGSSLTLKHILISDKIFLKVIIFYFKKLFFLRNALIVIPRIIVG